MWSNLCCWHFPPVAAGNHPTAVHTLRTHVSRHGTSETYGGGRQTVLRRWTSRYGITFQTGVVSRHGSIPSLSKNYVYKGGCDPARKEERIINHPSQPLTNYIVIAIVIIIVITII